MRSKTPDLCPTQAYAAAIAVVSSGDVRASGNPFAALILLSHDLRIDGDYRLTSLNELIRL